MSVNAIIFEKLRKIYTSLNGNSAQYYLTYAPESIISFTNEDFNFLDTNVTIENIKDKYENQMAFAMIADAIIRNPKIYEINTDLRLSDSYEKIFDDALIVDSLLSEDDKQASKNARIILYLEGTLDKTSKHIKYDEYKKKYGEITTQIVLLEEKNLQNPDNIEIKNLLEELVEKQTIVFNDWIIDGDKDAIEEAKKLIESISIKPGFSLKWTKEKNMLKSEISKITTISSDFNFLPVSCLPNDIFKYDYKWLPVTVDENEIITLKEIAKNNNTTNDFTIDEYLKIEFEYLFVSIIRNWFKPDIINSRYWTFKDDSQLVSDATDITKGLLPCYVDKFVFIRRVQTYNKIQTIENKPTISANSVSKVLLFKDLAKIKKITQLKEIKKENVAMARMNIIANMNIVKPVTEKTKGSAEIKINPISFNRFIKFPIPVVVQQHNFNVDLSFKDKINDKVLPDIKIILKSVEQGKSYSSDTGKEGNILFENIKQGEYYIIVKDEELYEDLEQKITVNSNVKTEIKLIKRPSPKFDMFLIGAINYRFPKLPNPLPDYIYS